MNPLTLPVRVKTAWIKPLLLGMLALSLVVGGWVLRGWKDGSDAKDAVQVKAEAAAKQHLALNASNQDTAKRMAALLTTLEGQAHAFARIDAYLAAHPVGRCTFDPAADRLLLDAYRAAFGPHPAGGGDGGAGPAGPAARPPQPAH